MIKDENIAHDAMIQAYKLNIFENTGKKKIFLGTDGTACYNLARSRVPDADLFTTLDAAINSLTTNRSDTIEVLPGHAETIATAGAVAVDIDGLEVNCHGFGDQRPTFTFSATASSILITGASFTMKNFIIVPSVDSVTNPLHIQAADCTLDFEVRDASSTVEFVRAILTTAAADRLTARIKYRGLIAGNACANVVRLVGCDGADIELDFYGKASTALVEFHTTACHDVNVTGKTYLSGTTDGSLNVVDTATGSTWYADVVDEAAGARYTGGSGSPIASDDISSVATLIGTETDATTDTVHGKLGTDAEMADNSIYDLLGAGAKTLAVSTSLGSDVDHATTDTVHGKIGTDTEMADSSLYDLLGAGAKTLAISTSLGSDVDHATTDTVHGKIGTDTEMADSSLYDMVGAGAKTLAVSTSLGSDVDIVTTDTVHGKLGTDVELADRSLFDLLAGDGPASYPAAAVPGNDVSLAEVLRDIWDALRNGTGGAEPATNRSLADYAGVSPAFYSPQLGHAVTKSVDLGAANDDAFTVTGKVLITLITGEVTTTLSGAEAYQLRVKTDNIALCAATTIDTDADGTHYMLTGDFGDTMCGGSTPGLRAAEVNSLGARGAFVLGDAGGSATIETNTTGNNGIILHTLFYIPLEAGASVVAAA